MGLDECLAMKYSSKNANQRRHQDTAAEDYSDVAVTAEKQRAFPKRISEEHNQARAVWTENSRLRRARMIRIRGDDEQLMILAEFVTYIP